MNDSDVLELAAQTDAIESAISCDGNAFSATWTDT
jgi:hypothetical protein